MVGSKKRQLSLGIVFSYITIIVQCLSGVIYTPIILQSLGQSEYGVYSLCMSFSGYLTIFDAGMNAAFIRFYVQTKTKEERKIPLLNGLFAKIFIILSLLSLILGLLLSWKAEFVFGSKVSSTEYILLKRLFAILAFNTSVTVFNCIFSSLIIANEQFIFGKLINLSRTILSPIITVPFLLNGKGSEIIFTVNLLLTIMVTIFNALYCFLVLKVQFDFRFRTGDKMLIKTILVFAGAIVLQSIMDQLNWQIDKFVLAWTSGTIEISIYSVGSTLNTYYITIATSMSGVFIAEVNRLVALKRDNEVSTLFVKTSRLFALLVLLIMSGYCLFGKPFILRWAGAEYGSSYYVGLLLMLPVTVSLTMGLGQDIVRAKNVHKKQIFINIAVSVCNVIISIPLAIRFGAIGSALGTFICEVIICIVIQSIYYNNVAKLNMKEYYKEMIRMLRGLILPVLLGIIIMKLDLVKANFLSIAVYGLIYVCIYAGSMWLFGMNSYEKGLIKKAMGSVITKVRGR